MRFTALPTLAASAVLALAGPYPAGASSPDAWETFRADVETACRDAAPPEAEIEHVAVDPFGSQSYGLALMFPATDAADAPAEPSVRVCVFDKSSREVEVGEAMPLAPDRGTDTGTGGETEAGDE